MSQKKQVLKYLVDNKNKELSCIDIVHRFWWMVDPLRRLRELRAEGHIIERREKWVHKKILFLDTKGIVRHSSYIYRGVQIG